MVSKYPTIIELVSSIHGHFPAILKSEEPHGKQTLQSAERKKNGNDTTDKFRQKDPCLQQAFEVPDCEMNPIGSKVRSAGNPGPEQRGLGGFRGGEDDLIEAVEDGVGLSAEGLAHSGLFEPRDGSVGDGRRVVQCLKLMRNRFRTVLGFGRPALKKTLLF